MDLLWALLLLAIVLLSMWLVRRYRHAGDAFYWPWLGQDRGDRAEQAYVAEEEIPRAAEADRERQRDPAP